MWRASEPSPPPVSQDRKPDHHKNIARYSQFITGNWIFLGSMTRSRLKGGRLDLPQVAANRMESDDFSMAGSARPEITFSMLLKSRATPPVRRPMDSIIHRWPGISQNDVIIVPLKGIFGCRTCLDPCDSACQAGLFKPGLNEFPVHGIVLRKEDVHQGVILRLVPLADNQRPILFFRRMIRRRLVDQRPERTCLLYRFDEFNKAHRFHNVGVHAKSVAGLQVRRFA